MGHSDLLLQFLFWLKKIVVFSSVIYIGTLHYFPVPFSLIFSVLFCFVGNYYGGFIPFSLSMRLVLY